MKKNKDYYFIGISAFFVIAFSIFYIISRTPLIQFVDTNSFNSETNNLVPTVGKEIKLGDIVVSNRQVKVKEYVSSENILYESRACSSCASSTEAEKNADGTYKSSSCAGKNPCYVNRYATYSNIGYISYKVSTGNWLMSDGDTHYCEGSCTLQAGSSSSTCTVSGACPTTIVASKGSKTYQTSISLDGTIIASGTVNVDYCSPTWSAGSTTKFFKEIWDRETAIENQEKVYMENCTPEICAEDGTCSLYRCNPGQWFARCNANPTAVKVCVYTPSGIGDNSFKYANSYKMTDSPTEEELKFLALDKDSSTCKGCFGNTPTYARSTKTSWSTGPSSETPYKYDEKTTEESCKPLPEPRICAPQDYTDDGKEEKTDVCEEEKNLFYEDGKKCVVDEQDAFYEIKCVNKIASLFDLNKDDIEVEVLDIKQGQSFAYEIESTSSKICYAKFNADVWLKAYNNVQAKFRALENESIRVSTSDKAAAREWYITLQSKIFDQVNDYLHWEPVLKNNPTAQVTLKLGSTLQPLNNPKGQTPANKIVQLQLDMNRSVDALYKKVATDDTNVVSTYKDYKEDIEKDRNGNHIMIMEGTDKVAIDIAKKYGIEVNSTEAQPSFNVDLGSGLYVNESMPSPAINLSDVKNYLWVTTTKEKDYLIPPSVTLNRIDGSILGGGSTPTVTRDGYNRIYTSMDIEKNKKYDLNVQLANLGVNNSSILDDKCKFKILNTELIYRVIEESNPFINTTRKKGYNWYRTGIDGTLYDFTNIIPNSNEYTITYSLSPNDIEIVKKSNKKNNDAYLGTCYYAVGDDAQEILCK